MTGRLRIARPTDRLEQLVAQYRAGLGLRELGCFEDHEGFDGVMLGASGSEAVWEIEFTHERGATAPAGSSPEHLMVFYVEDAAVLAERCGLMTEAGFRVVSSHNPYWDRCGKTFVDLDGYRVVVAIRRVP
ncbi:MAG: VOC family protein [Planctomycetota bacterium]